MNTHRRPASLRALRTFCVAARHQNFRKAAEHLHITASAVSHQVKSLEDELGQRLFERANGTLKLNDTGRSLYRKLDPLIDDIDSVVAKHRDAELGGTLRISVQPFLASELFVPQLREFIDEHPEFDIRIDTSDETWDVHPEHADVSIRLFASPPKNLSSDLLIPLRLVAAVAPEVKERLKVGKNRGLDAITLIVHDTRADGWREWQRVSGVRLPEPVSVLRLDSMIAVARAAERGMGAALVPVPMSCAWFESGSLVPLTDDVVDTGDAYYFVCDRDVAGKKIVSELRAWVLHNMTAAA